MKVVEGKEDRFGKHPIIFKSFNLKQIHQWLFNNYYGYKFAILIDEAIDEYQEIDEVYVYFLDEIAEEVADYCGAELIDRRCKKRAKYEEPKVDWSKVPIDTPILVWDDPDNLIDIDNIDDIKKQRYFAGYLDGKIYAWANGTTSWTAIDKTDWKHAELANVEEK